MLLATYRGQGQIDTIWPAGELCKACAQFIMTHMCRLPAVSINRQ